MKRYRMETDFGRPCFVQHVDDKDGDWVKYEDAKKLEDELEQCKKELEEARKELEVHHELYWDLRGA